MEKIPINRVYQTGNITSDARVFGKLAYITIAIYNGKDADGKERDAVFSDVAIVNCSDPSKLKKGQRISIVGKTTNYIDKKTNYKKQGIMAFSYKLIEKEIDLSKYFDEDKTKDVPWDLEL